jgi:hypothetical protein
VRQGGSLDLISNLETAGFTFQLDGGAIMTTAATLVAGTTIDMIGNGNALQITGGSTQNATVEGFNNTDTLVLTNLGLNSATISPAGALLALSNGSTLTLNGSFAGDRFVTIPTAIGPSFVPGQTAIRQVYTSSEVFLDSSVNEAPSAGTGSADTYAWIGGPTGDWGTAANWADVTQGQTPAIIAPGSLDTVFVNNTVLSGNGNAASLTWTGQDAAFDNINSGQVIVAGQLFVAGGATQTAAAVLQIGSGTAAGTLAAVNGGSVLTSSLTLTPNIANVVSIDMSSVVHVGAGTSATTGALTIDPGATVAGQGTLLGNVVGNGVIQTTNMTIGISSSIVEQSNPPFTFTGFSSSLSGTGTVEVLPGGNVVLGAPVSTTGLTFQLDGNANLQLEVPIGASNTINLTGAENVLTLDRDISNIVPLHGDLPSISATIAGFNATDTLVVQSSTVSVTAFQDGTLTIQDASGTTRSFDFAGLDPNDTWTTTAIPGSGVAVTIACFAAGTRIATPSGDIPVERLCQGDTVETVSGRCQPIQWIGFRTVDCRRHPEPERIMPVRVASHAFGLDRPRNDLFLSPDHAVFVEQVLIPIKYLINGSTIVQVPIDEVTYYHIALPRHDVLLAEGLPAESYLDVGDRSNFQNGGQALRLFPDFALDKSCEAIWESAGYAPLRIQGAEVGRTVASLRRQAKLLGYAHAGKARPKSKQRSTKTTDVLRLFNPDWYLATYPDVAAAGVDAAAHFAKWGRQEGRLPCDELDLIRGLGLIDPGTIVFTMADVVAAGLDPVIHFCQIGWQERRRPNLYFDTGWYLDNYDVPAGMNPLLHYLLQGERRGLSPSRHFDPVWYRQHYAIGAAVSALGHYLKHCRTQRYSPLPTFDVTAYKLTHRATLRPHSDPYTHFLAIGRSVPLAVAA